MYLVPKLAPMRESAIIRKAMDNDMLVVGWYAIGTDRFL
jgi:hypothetical protein